MAKFKVTATLTTTSVITKVIEAKNLHEATIHILKQAKMNEWRTKQELKTTSK